MPPELADLRATAVVYLVRTLWALLVVGVTFLLARLVRRGTMRTLTRHRAHANATILIGNIAQVVVLVVGLLVVLAIYTEGAFGWVLTSFSVIGIVLGLSLQDILKNFFAGLWVLVERPFRIGDTIEVDGHRGEIVEISFRTTQLRTADGREVIVPNATLMTNAVVNLSRYPLRRVAIQLTVPADDADRVDPAAVREALVTAGASAEPAPAVELRGVTEGRARFQVSFWARDRDAALPSALSAIRARFPQGEVLGA
ncbi:MAG TPA: mechanosensitive ion channel family protein [Candidatus Limnocylindria bacterium]|nr:mechanosensitive ion channel family protein [Candidatus Limnocylindria bacterium]